MIELLLIGVGVWCLSITWAVVNLYTRPSPTLPDDEIDVLRAFVERLRALSAESGVKRRRPKK